MMNDAPLDRGQQNAASEQSNKDVGRIARTITRAMYALRGQFGLTREQLAREVMLAAVSVGYSAWGPRVADKLRATADALEEDLASGREVFTEHPPHGD